MWCYNIQINMRNFEDWWKTVPIDLQQKTRKGDEHTLFLILYLAKSIKEKS